MPTPSSPHPPPTAFNRTFCTSIRTFGAQSCRTDRKDMATPLQAITKTQPPENSNLPLQPVLTSNDHFKEY